MEDVLLVLGWAALAAAGVLTGIAIVAFIRLDVRGAVGYLRSHTNRFLALALAFVAAAALVWGGATAWASAPGLGASALAASGPAASEPDASGSAAADPDASEPDASAPDASDPNTSRPDAITVIDLSQTPGLDGLPFRMPGDQEAELLAVVNAYVASQVEQEDRASLSSWFARAEIADEQAYLAAALSGLELSGDGALELVASDDLPACAERYEVTGLPQVSIRPVERASWASEPALKVCGSSLLDGGQTGAVELSAQDAKSRYLGAASVPYARIDEEGSVLSIAEVEQGGSPVLAPDQFDGAGGSVGLHPAGTGLHEGESRLFVRNANGVVRLIEWVRFLYDGEAPTLRSLNISKKGSHERRYDGSGGSSWAAEGFTVAYELADEGAGVALSTAAYGDDARDAQAEGEGESWRFTIACNELIPTDSISVSAIDRAGNAASGLVAGQAQRPQDVDMLAVMEDEPVLALSWEGDELLDGLYCAGSRRLTLRLSCPLFEEVLRCQGLLASTTLARVVRDGGEWEALGLDGLSRQADGSWACSLTLSLDGSYEVCDLGWHDLIGRTARVEAGARTLVIDTTAPRLEVSFDNDDARNVSYYNASRTATITLFEQNFSEDLMGIEAVLVEGGEQGAADGAATEEAAPRVSAWSHAGALHTARVSFPGQGRYALSLGGKDLAGNELAAWSCPEFVIDSVAPRLSIGGVSDKTAYAAELFPTLAVSDEHLEGDPEVELVKLGHPLAPDNGANPFEASASATEGGVALAWGSPARLRENDGVYTLSASACDLAGNTGEQSVTFSVNRFGSTYVATSETQRMLGRYCTSDELVDVEVIEINPSGVDEGQLAVELVRNGEGRSLVPGSEYDVSQGGEGAWQVARYRVGKELFSGRDGSYRVLLSSVDAAGNISENTQASAAAPDGEGAVELSFAVDDTAPGVSLVNLADGDYGESEHVGGVLFDDNLKLARAEIRVDGELVAKLGEEELAIGQVQEVRLAESGERQLVSAVAWDAAGNRSERTASLLVSTARGAQPSASSRNPLLPPALVLAALALVALAALVVAALLRGRSPKGRPGAPSRLAHHAAPPSRPTYLRMKYPQANTCAKDRKASQCVVLRRPAACARREGRADDRLAEPQVCEGLRARGQPRRSRVVWFACKRRLHRVQPGAVSRKGRGGPGRGLGCHRGRRHEQPLRRVEQRGEPCGV